MELRSDTKNNDDVRKVKQEYMLTTVQDRDRNKMTKKNRRITAS